MGTDLTALAPADVDRKLAEIYRRFYRAQRSVTLCQVSLRNAETSRWRREDDVVRCRERLEQAVAARDAIEAEAAPFDAEFDSRGGWTRAFLVTSSDGGHVHKDMHCSTCRPTTEYGWLPDYSGADEAAIVADAGERACTVCYPTAPVELRNRPTKIFSDEEREAQDAREKRERLRAEKAAAKAAKAIANPDGTPLRHRYGVTATESSAQMYYVDDAAYVAAVERGLVDGGRLEETRGDAERALAALAHKRGTTVDEQRELLAKKVQARVKRDYVR